MHVHCVSKNVMSNILQKFQQLLTEFENYFTMGNSNEVSTTIT